LTIEQRDRIFLQECENVKLGSHDPGRQVGAILVDDAGNIIAKGANRPPLEMKITRGESHQAINLNSEWKYFMLEHAERNAIFEANKFGRPAKGTTMYCTLFPCADCARAIVAAGIVRLIAPNFSGRAEDEKWQEHFKYTIEILRLGGVQLDFAHEKEQVIVR
jgi:dCMP deaminase